MIVCLLLFLIMLAIPLSIGVFRSLMTVLNKKSYEGLSVEKAQKILIFSGSFLVFVIMAGLFRFSREDHSSFRYFVGVDVREDIQLLYDKNSSHDEFIQYEACFRAGPASIEKIIAEKALNPVKKVRLENKSAVQCIGDEGTLQQYTKAKREQSPFSHHEEILLYNEAVQTAWYTLNEIR